MLACSLLALEGALLESVVSLTNHGRYRISSEERENTAASSLILWLMLMTTLHDSHENKTKVLYKMKTCSCLSRK
jgi:hypothetical protein